MHLFTSYYMFYYETDTSVYYLSENIYLYFVLHVFGNIIILGDIIITIISNFNLKL